MDEPVAAGVDAVGTWVESPWTGKPALMATIVRVEEAFFHCGKAMIRAKLWESPDDAEADRRPIAEQFGGILGDEKFVEVVAANLEQNYRDSLY